LPNEKIFGLTKEEISFTDSLNLLNSRLAMSLDGLLRAIYSPGLINIDWADIRTILEGKRKEAYLNVVKGKINQNLDEFIKSIFKNPILDTQFSNAESVLFNIDGSKELSLQTLAQISEKINELSPNAKIIFGLNQNPKMKNEIKVTILATKNNERKDIFKIKRAQPVVVEKKEKEKPITKKSEKKEVKALAKNVIEEKERVEVEQEETEQNIRRNALQAKEAERQAIEKEEESEKIFEIPAFLRKNKKK
jgi:cell division protein FtsZ